MVYFYRSKKYLALLQGFMSTKVRLEQKSRFTFLSLHAKQDKKKRNTLAREKDNKRKESSKQKMAIDISLKSLKYEVRSIDEKCEKGNY